MLSLVSRAVLTADTVRSLMVVTVPETSGVCKLQNESQRRPNVPTGKRKTRCDSCAYHNQQDSNIINAKNKPAVSMTGSRDDEDSPAFKLRRVLYKSLSTE